MSVRRDPRRLLQAVRTTRRARPAGAASHGPRRLCAGAGGGCGHLTAESHLLSVIARSVAPKRSRSTNKSPRRLPWIASPSARNDGEVAAVHLADVTFKFTVTFFFCVKRSSRHSREKNGRA